MRDKPKKANKRMVKLTQIMVKTKCTLKEAKETFKDFTFTKR